MARRPSHPATYVTPQRGSHLVGEACSLGSPSPRIMQVGPIGSGGHRRALTVAQTGRSDRAVVTKSGWRDRRVRDTSILNHPILSCTVIYNQSVAANRGSTSFALWCKTTGVIRELGRNVHLCRQKLPEERGQSTGTWIRKGAGEGRLWWRDQPS